MSDIERSWALYGEDTGHGGTAQNARPADAASWLRHGEEVEVVPASQLAGAVEDRDALRVMLKRLLNVALVDGYGETVRDEAEALLK